MIKPWLQLLASACCLLAISDADAEPANAAGSRPNFLVILADDLGYSDVGAYGGEISTPNIDGLARQGLMFTSFYAAATCSPTRAMLLSGVDHHRAGVGAMMEHIAPNQRGQPGYEGHLNDHVRTIAERLHAVGYRTYMTGKWHLGMTEETSPAVRGFDHSFALLSGGAGHFDQTGLVPQDNPARYREDGRPVDLPADFGYSTDFYTRRMEQYIGEAVASRRPFFAYLAYTAPHFPLQAPREDIDKYKGRYDVGWEIIRQRRLARMKERGLLPAAAMARQISTDWLTWEELAPEQRQVESRRMEVYAAMVDHLDRRIGELLEFLDQKGVLRNTVVLFMSDNGAEGAPLQDMPGMRRWVDHFDNSLESMGSRSSYVLYEERWAQVSNTPLRLYKGMPSEGGVRVPAIIRYPGFARQRGRTNAVVSVLDVMPTFLEMAGIVPAADTAPALYPLQGKSLLPLLEGNADAVRGAGDGLGWEQFNKMGYRLGDWKAVHIHPPLGPDIWQLYDLKSDPGEVVDLAAREPGILQDLVGRWESYATANGVVLGSTPPQR